MNIVIKSLFTNNHCTRRGLIDRTREAAMLEYIRHRSPWLCVEIFVGLVLSGSLKKIVNRC